MKDTFFNRQFVAANLRRQLRCPKCACEFSNEGKNEKAAENRRPFLLPCGHNMCELCIAGHDKETDIRCAACGCPAPPTVLANGRRKLTRNVRDFYELNYHVLGETKSLECTNSRAGHQHMEHSQSLGELRPNGLDAIHVGRDIFRMPLQLRCHNAPASVYCDNCRDVMCDACHSSHNPNHITSSVYMLNQKYIIEVPATINTIDAALLQVNNAQLVVKNTKQKLGDFATETLTNISAFFRLLHGQLQIAEQRAIEALRSASEPPELQLNGALDQLNGYESVLKKMHNVLNNAIHAPHVLQETWLRNTLMLVEEHLEKIPSHVQITKLGSNPYYFKGLKENFVQLFECEFVNPQLEVRLSNEFGHQFVILANDDMATDSATSISCRCENQSDTESSAGCSSGRDTDSQMLNIPGPDAVTHLGNWFRTGEQVYVTCIQSPVDFYVQCVAAAQQISEKLEAFLATLDCQPPRSIVVGRLYIAYLKHSKVDRCHRVLVTQKAEAPGMYNVFLPDIGVTQQQVHRDKFLLLPHNLAMLPYAAVNCSLKQLLPNSRVEWEPQAGAFFKMLVENNPVKLKVPRSQAPPLYEVDLLAQHRGMEVSVRSCFLYTCMAQLRGEDGVVKKLMAPLRLRLSQNVSLHVGDVLLVRPLHAEHPQNFYVLPQELEQKLQMLQQALDKHMRQLNITHTEPIYMGLLQLGCVLEWQSHWRRACIEDILQKGSVLVRLIDCGVSLEVHWTQLFMLPVEFRWPGLAIRCCMFDEPDKDFACTTSGVAAFKQLVSTSDQLQLQVIHVCDKIAHVTLHIPRSTGGSSGLRNRQPVPTYTRHWPAETPSRTSLSIVMRHVEHPHEFYVTLTHLLPAIAELKLSIQDAVYKIYQREMLKSNWSEGAMCYVKTIAKEDAEPLWYRGQIVSVANSEFSVRLRDTGELTKNVAITHLVAADDELLRISNAAIRCRLYDVVPNGAEWSAQSIEFFQAQVHAFQTLLLTVHGRDIDNNCIQVTLWGVQSGNSGSLSHTNLNLGLVQAGWALTGTSTNQTLNPGLEMSISSNSGRSCRCSSNEDYDQDQFLNCNCQIMVQCSNRALPLALLEDLNSEKKTTGCTEAPLAWLQPQRCRQRRYIAQPTRVNDRWELYVSLARDKFFVQYMHSVLADFYMPMLGKQEPSLAYVVGQPVLAVSPMDNLLYRGVVISKMNARGAYEVYYVDYGDKAEVWPTQMLPYAPFPQLNALCWPIDIHGVRPSNGMKCSPKVVNTWQVLIAEHICVEVIKAYGGNGLPLCQIKVDDKDIDTMLMKVDDKNLRIAKHPFQSHFRHGDGNKEGLAEGGFFNEECVEYLAALGQTTQASYGPPEATDQRCGRIEPRYKELLERFRFSPLATSSVRSYPCAINPQCPTIGVTQQISCRIKAVLSATQLLISLKPIRQGSAMTQETCAWIREAPQLHPVRVHAKCLARYSQDNQWYRAIVREPRQAFNEAVVYFFDFLEIATVPISDLKELPKQWFTLPQKPFRVKIHGVRANKIFTNKCVRRELQACLHSYSTVLACIYFPINDDVSSDDDSSELECNSYDYSWLKTLHVHEVQIYENKFKTEPLYKPLIDNQMYLMK